MEFSLFGVVGVGSIAVICYAVGYAAKQTSKYIEGLDDFIPVICALMGAILGIVGYKVMPDYPASDPITAVAVGIVSGLAATGINEAIKQLKGNSKEKADE